MSSSEEIKNKEILIEGNHTFKTVTDKISGLVEMKNTKAWLVGFGISNMLLLLLLISIVYLFWEGVGIWGLNNPVGWGFAIVNFVFWVGKIDKKLQSYFWSQLSKIVENKFCNHIHFYFPKRSLKINKSTTNK